MLADDTIKASFPDHVQLEKLRFLDGSEWPREARVGAVLPFVGAESLREELSGSCHDIFELRGIELVVGVSTNDPFT